MFQLYINPEHQANTFNLKFLSSTIFKQIIFTTTFNVFILIQTNTQDTMCRLRLIIQVTATGQENTLVYIISNRYKVVLSKANRMKLPIVGIRMIF